MKKEWIFTLSTGVFVALIQVVLIQVIGSENVNIIRIDKWITISKIAAF